VLLPKKGESKILSRSKLIHVSEQSSTSTKNRLMLRKLLLSGSLTALAIGASGFGTASQWGVALPLGAVLFILFFIVTLLEKETVLYDAEHRQKQAEVESPASVRSLAGRSCRAS
jgi:hypothetical protein